MRGQEKQAKHEQDMIDAQRDDVIKARRHIAKERPRSAKGIAAGQRNGGRHLSGL